MKKAEVDLSEYKIVHSWEGVQKAIWSQLNIPYASAWRSPCRSDTGEHLLYFNRYGLRVASPCLSGEVRWYSAVPFAQDFKEEVPSEVLSTIDLFLRDLKIAYQGDHLHLFNGLAGATLDEALLRLLRAHGWTRSRQGLGQHAYVRGESLLRVWEVGPHKELVCRLIGSELVGEDPDLLRGSLDVFRLDIDFLELLRRAFPPLEP